jgi:hypothetical protein
MSIFTTLRDRVSTPEPGSVPADGGKPDLAVESELPFAGYDRLGARQVIDGLHDHSQVELEAIEGYERSHQDREAVLDKLRWMRGSEPLSGYDGLSVQAIVTALGAADLATIKKVRGYERKFANRPDVLEEVVRSHHRRLAERPAGSAPNYQPLSVTPAASPRGEQPATKIA